MKKRIIKGLFITSVVLVFFSCKNEETVVIDSEQVKAEIQAKENEFADVYNSGVTKNIGYHAEDAVTYPQNSGPIVGKKAIVNYLETHRDTLSIGNKISFKTNEVFVSNDGIQVVEIGYYKIVDSAQVIVNSGNYMSLFIKKNGKYECFRDMSTSDMPIQ
jgi:ketosteroid isomerase-like protein